MSVKVSICITTYNRVSYLERLLDSIAVQTFRDFDILITDNSESTIVKDFVADYQDKLPIQYHKNVPSVGMTENWNICMGMAKGEWIKLIHDDDWLAHENALAMFVEATGKGARFIYGARNDYYEATGQLVPMPITQEHFNKISNDPYLLMADNVLGPPTVLMFHSSVKEYYDPALTWFVDIEYYATFLGKEPAVYIPVPLVNICYNPSQVTNSCLRNPDILIPELLYVLNKHKVARAGHIRTYDAWWRLLRNVEIRSMEELNNHSRGRNIPAIIRSIINHQRLVPVSLLKNGFISKAAMALSYVIDLPVKNKY